MGRKGTGVTVVSDSSYEIAFTYKGKRCRERVKAKPCPANTRKLSQFAAAVRHAIDKGEFDYAKTFPNSKHAAAFAERPGDVLTVEKYFDQWLTRKQSEIKASTYKGYYGIVNRFVIPKFGKLALSDLKRAAIRDWLATIDEKKDEKVTNKRLSNIQSCMRSALGDAVADEIIDASPLAGYTYSRIERPVAGEPDDEVDPFTSDEQAAILSKMRAGERNLTQFFLWTGLRTSEAIELNWSDIDFIGGYVRVRRALTREAKGVAELPKTTAGRRDVKLLGPARTALLAQKELTFMAELDGPVFVNPTTRKRFTGSHQFWRVWQTALKHAGIRYRRPYQTRHTYASMMLSAGEHPMWVAKQMGHADWTMIARVYGRWMPSADESAGNRAVEKFAVGTTGLSDRAKRQTG
ncbi:site-specific integrase [Paraburkholderia sp. UCT2]|uniref:site-specific integrase n=1 Tax=Paraburkholderia sp. UCT2 TaxID=2615208 RepID=UPI0016566E19|nr:site-specific integrase [Paraburkholderia sp. UCT2]MBC8730030.1 site-specific integrase [Paraburkholderia sp. UCT2]